MDTKNIKRKTEWEETVDSLQAIIIAESFDEKFAPITYEKPRALLPVVNRLMIDYTLEMLYKTDVKEILVVAKSHSEQIKNYLIELSYFKKKEIVIKMIVVNSNTCSSVGDALREIDRNHRALLKEEFILIYGFVISKGDLTHLLKAHYIRKARNDNIIMTIVFNNYPPTHQARSDDEIFVVSNPSNNEILHLQHGRDKYYNIPLTIMNQKNCVQVYHNLSDTGIYFMDLRALALFSDNYDYITIDSLIHNVIGDDVIQKSICYDIVTDEYFGTVRNLMLYHSISLDILRRWTYPNVPDLNGYTFHPNNVYLGKNVEINRTADIKSLVLIGHNTIIERNTKIDRSIIGTNCVIGHNTRIVNSYIWDNVKIQSYCVISNSIICNGVNVLKDTELKRGCILSYGITVGPSVILPQLTIVYIPNFDGRYMPTHPTLLVDLGKKSNGNVFAVHVSDIDKYHWGSFVPSSRNLKLEEDSEEESEDFAEARVADLDHRHEFYFEVQDSILAGITDRVPVDNIITEINVSKHTHNITVEDMTQTIIDVLNQWLFTMESVDHNHNVDFIKKRLKICAPFCRKFFGSQNQLLNCLSQMEEFIFKSANLLPLYSAFIFQIYLNDIADESILIAWRNYANNNNMNYIINKRSALVDKLLESLKNMSEESSSEENSCDSIDEESDQD